MAATGEQLLSRLTGVVGQVLIPAGAVTGVLYYFGYVRERAFFSYYGVPLGSLDLTTTDYVLRSTQAVFTPLASLLLAGLLALVAHQLLAAYLGRVQPLWWRRGWLLAAAVAGVLLLLGALSLNRLPPLAPVAGALSLGAGALLLEYAVWMAGLDPGLARGVRGSLVRSRWPRRSVLAGITLVALFWWTANVANANGVATALAIERSLPVRGEAVVLSDRPLAIEGRGVEATMVPGRGFRHRYTGLRVLAHTGRRWVLLPVGWRRDGSEVAILLRDDEAGIRVDVRP